MPDPAVFGGDPRQVWDCQWPGCRAIAAHKGHRGIHMPYMFVCEHHLLMLRNVPDLEAFKASEERQPIRFRNVAKSHVPWLLEHGDEQPTW